MADEERAAHDGLSEEHRNLEQVRLAIKSPRTLLLVLRESLPPSSRATSST